MGRAIGRLLSFSCPLLIVTESSPLSHSRLQWSLAHGKLHGRGCGRGLVGTGPSGYQDTAGSSNDSPSSLTVYQQHTSVASK